MPLRDFVSSESTKRYYPRLLTLAARSIHTLTHYTHLYHLLQPSGPNQNYVHVENDFQDLPSKMEDILVNPLEAQRIANNAAATFRDRYVTPAAQTCYFRRLFSTWAAMTDEPEPYEWVMNAEGVEQKKWRGMTFEEYMYVCHS